MDELYRFYKNSTDGLGAGVKLAFPGLVHVVAYWTSLFCAYFTVSKV